MALDKLACNLKLSASIEEKNSLLEKFYPSSSSVKRFLKTATSEEQVVIRSILALGQEERLFTGDHFTKRMRNLLQQLLPIEKFYREIGGLIGYHVRMQELLSFSMEKKEGKKKYLPAEGIDISKDTEEVRKSIIDGIFHLDEMAELYPLGGAADRLRLVDEKTGVALPAARLPFRGKTLLEGLIADLQSREYLYYKLFGKRVVTPVAIMTSQEKNNHAHILAICEESRWFGRPKESFRFFCQPSVPTVNRDGKWCLQGPMQLLLKPGGHGVIWRLARDEGIIDWFFSKGRKKALVRQINNPVANTDYGLLAFTGIGCAQDKIFGFASCPRQVKASEGINVLVEGDKEWVLTNIEYCDFKKFGIDDQPERPGSPYSKFSSNTNILFVDLGAILEAVAKCPIPGILVNLKKLIYHTDTGEKKEEEIARLESTMQNIADFFTAPSPKELKTYLTYNDRHKTISTAKREFALGASLFETPEGCFLDILNNGRDLLCNACQFDLPEVSDPTSFFIHGPSFLFLYHPTLGPLYSIIAQKLRKGHLHPGAELQLEIAELDIEGLDLKGTLLIQAESIEEGRCTLKNVTVHNEGIDFEAPNVYWKNEIVRQEACQIILHGNGEFYAENLTLQGDMKIEVEENTKVTATLKNGKVELIREKITTPSWSWNYHITKERKIEIKKR